MINPEDIRKLLGGYATGTLTPEEQQALFAAALADQELFDALAREQSLRDLLRDPAARGQLLAAIDARPLPWYRRYWRPLAMAAAAAAGLVCAGIYLNHSAAPPVKPVLMAKINPEPPPEISMPAAAAPAEPAVKAAPRRQKTVKEEAAAPTVAAPLPAAPPALAAATDAKQTVEPATPAPAAAAAPPLARATSGTLAQKFMESNSQTIPLQNAQAMFYAGEQKKAARAQAAPYLGVKWTILRQRDGGDFAEVGPDQIAAGDSVKLRLIPNDDGFVSISDGALVVLKPTAVRRLQPFDSPAITSAQPARKILTVQFARMQGQAQTTSGLMQQQSATDSQEHATYVLKVNSSEPVSVQARLVFK